MSEKENVLTSNSNQAKLTFFKACDIPSKTAKPKLTAVFIHGIAADSSSFKNALSFLEKQKSLEAVRLIAYDLLGSGKSPKADDLEYNFSEFVTALASALTEADIKTPLILVGHSMGTFIVARYAAAHPEQVQKLVLISAPLFRPEDFKNPRFRLAIDGFRQTVLAKNRLTSTLDERVFEAELQNLVLDPENYRFFAETKLPTTIIYGNLDQIINLPNLPKLLKESPQITAVETVGGHSVSHEKYHVLAKILEKALREEEENAPAA